MKKIAVAAAIAASGLVAAPVAALAYPAPAVIVIPGQVGAETSFVVTGSGFQPGEEVKIQVTGTDGKVQTLTTTADAAGNISVTVPGLVAGAYAFTATGTQSGRVAVGTAMVGNGTTGTTGTTITNNGNCNIITTGAVTISGNWSCTTTEVNGNGNVIETITQAGNNLNAAIINGDNNKVEQLITEINNQGGTVTIDGKPVGNHTTTTTTTTHNGGKNNGGMNNGGKNTTTTTTSTGKTTWSNAEGTTTGTTKGGTTSMAHTSGATKGGTTSMAHTSGAARTATTSGEGATSGDALGWTIAGGAALAAAGVTTVAVARRRSNA